MKKKNEFDWLQQAVDCTAGAVHRAHVYRGPPGRSYSKSENSSL
jgi:hypothetical protein